MHVCLVTKLDNFFQNKEIAIFKYIVGLPCFSQSAVHIKQQSGWLDN